MAFSLIGHDKGALGNANTTTTPSINTTGADLLVAVCSDYDTGATLTDSKSNTWASLTVQTATVRARIMYAKNATVGSGHTFTLAGAGLFPSLEVAAFSGSDLTSPFDVENGAASASASSLAPGSITPGSANELVVSGLSTQGASGTKSIDVLSILDQVVGLGSNFDSALAYEIQTTATARNPSWSWTGNRYAAAVIATFKSAAAASFTYFPLIQPDVAGLLRKAEMQGY